MASGACTSAHAGDPTHAVTDHPVFEEALQDTQVVASLNALLGNHYGEFRSRFDEVAEPAPLRGGGLLLDGWRRNAYDTQAAAVVLLPDGSLHAAYFDGNRAQVVCFSSAGGRCHVALAIWAKRFGPARWSGAQATQPVQDLPTGKKRTVTGPDAAAQMALRQVAASIWSDQMVRRSAGAG